MMMIRLISKGVPAKKMAGGKNSLIEGPTKLESPSVEVTSVVTAFTSSAISCFGAWSFCSRVDEHAGSPSSSISFGFVVETWVIDPQVVRGITQDFTGKKGGSPNLKTTYRSAETLPRIPSKNEQ